MVTKKHKYKELKDLSKEEMTILEKWRMANGCVTWDLKDDNILIHDGGLFSIDDDVKRKQNFDIKFEKSKTPHRMPNGKLITGNEMIKINKPGTHLEHNYKAYVWPSELDETIQFLQSLKRVLNKVGIETDRSVKWQKKLAHDRKAEGVDKNGNKLQGNKLRGNKLQGNKLK